MKNYYSVCWKNLKRLEKIRKINNLGEGVNTRKYSFVKNIFDIIYYFNFYDLFKIKLDSYLCIFKHWWETWKLFLIKFEFRSSVFGNFSGIDNTLRNILIFCFYLFHKLGWMEFYENMSNMLYSDIILFCFFFL